MTHYENLYSIRLQIKYRFNAMQLIFFAIILTFFHFYARIIRRFNIKAINIVEVIFFFLMNAIQCIELESSTKIAIKSFESTIQKCLTPFTGKRNLQQSTEDFNCQ